MFQRCFTVKRVITCVFNATMRFQEELIMFHFSLSDYNYQNYILEMSKFVLRRKNMLLKSYVVSAPRRHTVELKLWDAVKKNMVFSLLGYYPAVRHKLVSLGWVERWESKTVFDHRLKTNFSVINLDSAPYIVQDETLDSFNANIHEQEYMSDKLKARDARPNILFSLKKSLIQWDQLDSETIVSNFPKCNFCNKLGLNICLEQSPVFRFRNDFLRYPRGYNMMNVNEMKRFTRNFRESACYSLMRYIDYCLDLRLVISADKGTIAWSSFEFAAKICYDCINRCQLEYLDSKIPNPQNQLDESPRDTIMWTRVTQDIYDVTSQRLFFKYKSEAELKEIHSKARRIVEMLKEYNEQELYEGMHNVWVLKPVANCSGHGIRLYRNLEDIKKTVGPLVNQTLARYVLQKYIERPMLIYGVKFDLRLWFVVTNIHTLKIWSYREGYVRFCSKPFSNIFLDESRHLTNVRIQRARRNTRDPAQLPRELMWDFKQLKEYFDQLNIANKWKQIMTAMEKSLITIMKCATTTNLIGLRKNAFQLFGADFLIHENYEPCLIEVNNGPGLSPTSSIIAKKTTELLADMVKIVIVDRDPQLCHQKNPRDVGKFNLIYNGPIEHHVEEHNKTAALKSISTVPVDIERWKRTSRFRNLHARTSSAKYGQKLQGKAHANYK